MIESYCRCPGCGRCDAHRKIEQVQAKLDAAYAELRKQRPAITAIFDGKVWAAVTRWEKEKP